RTRTHPPRTRRRHDQPRRRPRALRAGRRSAAAVLRTTEGRRAEGQASGRTHGRRRAGAQTVRARRIHRSGESFRPSSRQEQPGTGNTGLRRGVMLAPQQRAFTLHRQVAMNVTIRLVCEANGKAARVWSVVAGTERPTGAGGGRVAGDTGSWHGGGSPRPGGGGGAKVVRPRETGPPRPCRAVPR